MKKYLFVAAFATLAACIAGCTDGSNRFVVPPAILNLACSFDGETSVELTFDVDTGVSDIDTTVDVYMNGQLVATVIGGETGNSVVLDLPAGEQLVELIPNNGLIGAVAKCTVVGTAPDALTGVSCRVVGVDAVIDWLNGTIDGEITILANGSIVAVLPEGTTTATLPGVGLSTEIEIVSTNRYGTATAECVVARPGTPRLICSLDGDNIVVTIDSEADEVVVEHTAPGEEPVVLGVVEGSGELTVEGADVGTHVFTAVGTGVEGSPEAISDTATCEYTRKFRLIVEDDQVIVCVIPGTPTRTVLGVTDSQLVRDGEEELVFEEGIAQTESVELGDPFVDAPFFNFWDSQRAMRRAIGAPDGDSAGGSEFDPLFFYGGGEDGDSGFFEGASMALRFVDNIVVDGPGPDLRVYEVNDGLSERCRLIRRQGGGDWSNDAAEQFSVDLGNLKAFDQIDGIVDALLLFCQNEYISEDAVADVRQFYHEMIANAFLQRVGPISVPTDRLKFSDDSHAVIEDRDRYEYGYMTEIDLADHGVCSATIAEIISFGGGSFGDGAEIDAVEALNTVLGLELCQVEEGKFVATLPSFDDSESTNDPVFTTSVRGGIPGAGDWELAIHEGDNTSVVDAQREFTHNSGETVPFRVTLDGSSAGLRYGGTSFTSHINNGDDVCGDLTIEGNLTISWEGFQPTRSRQQLIINVYGDQVLVSAVSRAQSNDPESNKYTSSHSISVTDVTVTYGDRFVAQLPDIFDDAGAWQTVGVDLPQTRTIELVGKMFCEGRLCDDPASTNVIKMDIPYCASDNLLGQVLLGRALEEFLSSKDEEEELED